MEPIGSPDSFHLSAASGWLDLGNAAEAIHELSQISIANSDHPDVLEVRWAVCAVGQHWSDALGVARALLQSDPHRASGWLHQAYALRRADGGGIHAAWEALLPAADAFPQEPTIPYNLACYACQMGDLETARHWFHRTLKLGELRCLKEMALKDPDLKPLWKEIRAL